MINLSGKTVFITGGSRGIGRACALLFARAGAIVAFSYSRNRTEARRTADDIAALGARSLALPLDLTSIQSCRNAVQRVLHEFGRIDILVNNAGIWEEGPIATMTERQWLRTIDVNLNSLYRLCRSVVPVMKKQRSGKIINIASTAGQRGEAFHSHYAASKGGMIAFTKSIAVELIPHGIRVNCVAPGWVLTDMTASVSRRKAFYRRICRDLPRGKFATPGEIAGPVLFLASDLAENVVGEILNVNGGSVLCG